MNKEDLILFMTSSVCRLRSEGREGTAHVYNSTLNRIRSFDPRRRVFFRSITPCWLRSFESFLLGQQLSLNTVSTYMRMLRSVYNQAVEQGLAPYVPRLFKQVYTGTRVGESRSLSSSSLHRLMRPGRSLPADLERTRCLFVLLFMLRGICFVDVAFLRRCDFRGDVIRYRRHKTGRELTVHVEPEASAIIRRYISHEPEGPYLFPFLGGGDCDSYRLYQQALRSFNLRLKRLARALGIGENLSSYCARHSWATLANFRHYDKELICNAMGHSSVKVTETYFRSFRQEEINTMNKGIISYVESFR